MTSAQIRQSFLDFFRSKQHTIVSSASLMPDSPNLLFTNAGMNQFVPIFLGQKKCPYAPGRAADTQKCIRAGGKHNDLEDVGLDTYHHTFFEMLGNWSFGDYFKKEAIDWAWELITEVWKFPKERLYATVYSPDKAKGDPAEFDQEAWDAWAEKFRAAGLDPAVHIVNGNKKDNFWMMGETGPCGPCTELHVDLTPKGDTQGKLVNVGVAECIEIWNLVFMQFNANPDGTFSKLPAHGVDTGMGFERVTSILQCTDNFKNFSGIISNYETDIFRPIFDALEKASGKRYASTLPKTGSQGENAQEKIDVAFRVIADHLRTLSFAIADGIQPGNNDRNYVLRRILRRAVKYGRTLGFQEPFFYKLVDVLAVHMGDIFPEIRSRKNHVQEVIRIEEEAFNRTLDRGMDLFENEVARMAEETETGSARFQRAESGFQPGSFPGAYYSKRRLPHYERPFGIYHVTFSTHGRRVLSPEARTIVKDALLHFDRERYELFALCVMPDHVHVLLQSLIKERDAAGAAVFWSLSEIFHSVKSFSANAINKLEAGEGTPVWEKESHDRLMRGDVDAQEKFEYICQNPWKDGVAKQEEPYAWLWTWADRPDTMQDSRQDAANGTLEARAPQQGEATAFVKADVTGASTLSGDFAFKLYDTYGFPLDLTELLARERGLTVDTDAFEKLMEAQRERARAAQKREVISLSEIETKEPTVFCGFEQSSVEATVKEVVRMKDKVAVILDTTVCYAEMGGQVGDTGVLASGAESWAIVNTQKSGDTFLHFLRGEDAPEVGTAVTVSFAQERRAAISRHHTGTHLLHWALHQVVGGEVSQKGSQVNDEKLTFDFNSGPLSAEQVVAIERMVIEKIMENAPVSWTEVPYVDVKGRADVMQFFGDKYGDKVRVVQVGGTLGQLNGYSMELCGGTHVRATGEIGLFRIVSESAIAAGVRRIEAVAGTAAYALTREEVKKLGALAGTVGASSVELIRKVELLVEENAAMEKKIRAYQQKENAVVASEFSAKAKMVKGLRFVGGKMSTETPQMLREVVNETIKKADVVLLSGVFDGKVSVVCQCSPAAIAAGFQAGTIIKNFCGELGGKGGGKPDSAMGGGSNPELLDKVLAEFERRMDSLG